MVKIWLDNLSIKAYYHLTKNNSGSLPTRLIALFRPYLEFFRVSE
jgi:hypothetical protein